MGPNDVPHIQAQCADCGFLFDLKFGTDCPACHHVGVSYVRLVTDEEYMEERKLRMDAARTALRSALDAPLGKWVVGGTKAEHPSFQIPYPTLYEQKSIDECEKIYALSSEGSGQ